MERGQTGNNNGHFAGWGWTQLFVFPCLMGRHGLSKQDMGFSHGTSHESTARETEKTEKGNKMER
jgi:hypothetical protein